MKHQIEDIVKQFKDICDFKVTSPYVQHLWDVNNEIGLLDDAKADLFHLLKAKLIYITKSKITDIKPAVVFLITRFIKSNVYDWNKLRRCISYLNQTVDDVRIIGVINITDFFTQVDALYAVHPNMRSHTGELMPMGYGMPHCQSSKQNLNENISTESELIGTSEYVLLNVQTVMFMEA